MDLSNLKRDSGRIESGEWVDDIPGMGDLRLRVRGLSSPTVTALRARKQRKATKSERNGDGSLKTDVELRIFGEVLHEAVLLEWDCLTDGGVAIPYDAEKARKWLTDPDFMPFADAVTYAAQIVDRGFLEVADTLEKNSRRLSRGNSDTGTPPTA